jgi:hypothetical protein
MNIGKRGRKSMGRGEEQKNKMRKSILEGGGIGRIGRGRMGKVVRKNRKTEEEIGKGGKEE